LPPFLVPCIAGNAHSSFAKLGVLGAEQIAATKLTCLDKSVMKTSGHCHLLLQFMWWAAQPDMRTVEYRIAMMLLMDPIPSVIRWQDAATLEALGAPRVQIPTTTTGTTAGPPDPSHKLFSGALVDALGSLKMIMDAINLKETADGEKGTHFTRLPDHLKTLLYRISYVPGAAEPTALTPNGERFMAQYTLANATSLIKTAL
jgi:hypothetical protein